MKQMTFADAEYAGKRKQTRKELFLIEMDQVVPWKGLIALIEPHYPKGEGGRPAYPLMAMLRIHLMQNWFGYSDPAMEEALYETTILRQFAGLSLERIPDETTILNFRRLLEKHELAAGILGVINGYLGDRGLSLVSVHSTTYWTYFTSRRGLSNSGETLYCFVPFSARTITLLRLILVTIPIVKPVRLSKVTFSPTCSRLSACRFS